MKILLTGATGFIGNSVLKLLLKNGHSVGVICRDKSSLKFRNKNIDYIIQDLNDQINIVNINKIKKYKKIIHLAWSDLDNFNSLNHLNLHLFSHINFINTLVSLGINDITISGTCLEYGYKFGELKVDDITNPITSYGIAKDTLRRYLEQLKLTKDFNLKWVRIFYIFGKSQSNRTIISQLDDAVKNNKTHFDMSSGEQLRDYLSISEVSEFICKVSIKNNCSALYNCCSGKPISIRKFIEDYISRNKYKIKINLGVYNYLDYEPLAFWGKKSIL